MAETDDKDYAGETGQVGDTHSNRTSEDQPRGIELQVMKSREPAAADGDAGAPPPLESDGKWREAFPKGRFLKRWYRTSCGKQACCCACNCCSSDLRVLQKCACLRAINPLACICKISAAAISRS